MVVILLLGLGGYWYWWLRPPSQPTPSLTKAISNENISLANTLTGYSNSVIDVAISPDGQTLVSGSLDNTIKIWRVPK